MGKILRDPTAAARENYDLIVIGGGIYGAMLSMESSRRGLRSLLIERDDFGGATSFNSLRIIHGGIRYLQSLDLKRFLQFVRERRWFVQNFPDLVRPLPCIMPLYGNGLRRPLVFRLVLNLNDFLSLNRNRDSSPNQEFPHSHVINEEQTKDIFPAVDTKSLQGGAVWYDACVPDSQRLIIEILRWACKQGATVLNYAEATELLRNSTGVGGVVAIDRETGVSHEYRADVVINAAGPWCRDIANRFDRDEPELFRSSLAWNVFLNRKALSDYAVAVAPKRPNGRTYFILPWKGRMLAGTGHAPWHGAPDRPMPSSEQLQEFLNDLNLAVPKLGLDQTDILHVFAGLLPVERDGSIDLASREVILNHAHRGGPQGLYSVSGVKFTTSRRVAEKTLKRIFPEKINRKNIGSLRLEHFQNTVRSREAVDFGWDPHPELKIWKQNFLQIIREESVQHLDDLILRRTTLWENPPRALELSQMICELFGWKSSQKSKELQRLKHALGEQSFKKNKLK
jgi:glycerol-3-phosphate dehydrogenase